MTGKVGLMLSDSVAQRPPALPLDGIAAALAQLETTLHDVSRTEYPLVRDVVRAAFAHSGPRLRPAVSLLVGQLASAPIAETQSLAASVETLYAASRVHDDLIDQSFLRRSHPTLNPHLSAEASVLAGDYLFARAAAFAAETGSARVVRVFSECLMTMCGGELAHLATRRGMPTCDEYLARSYAKTGVLFATAAECAAILGDLSEKHIDALRHYGESVGLACQIADDCLHFTASAATLGQPDGDGPCQGDARAFATTGVAHLAWFPPVDARHSLEWLAHFVVDRGA